MFDPRDDARDRDGREDGRARVYDERDRDDDPREGLMRDLDLPRGEERELVLDRAREYEMNGEDSRTLAAVGAFRVVPEHDLDVDQDTLEHLHDESLVVTVDLGDAIREGEVRPLRAARAPELAGHLAPVGDRADRRHIHWQADGRRAGCLRAVRQ